MAYSFNQKRFSEFEGELSCRFGTAPAAFSLQPQFCCVARCYFADTNNQRIRKITGATISTFAGTGVFGFTGDNGTATNASLRSPRGVFADTAGNVYITDTSNDRIRKVIP